MNDGAIENDGGRGRPPATAEKASDGHRGWLIALLLISLAFNMLVIGAVGTMLYFHYSGRLPPWAGYMPETGARHVNPAHRRHARLLARRGRPGVVVRAMWQTLREMPETRRKALRETLRRHRKAIREAYREVGELRLALSRALAKGADGNVVKGILERLREADVKARGHVMEMTRDFLSALDDDEKRLFAARLRKALDRRRTLREERTSPTR